MVRFTVNLVRAHKLGRSFLELTTELLCRGSIISNHDFSLHSLSFFKIFLAKTRNWGTEEYIPVAMYLQFSILAYWISEENKLFQRAMCNFSLKPFQVDFVWKIQ